MSRDRLWQTRRVAACLPGCTAVEEIEPGQRYKAQFADAIGPYKAKFDLDVVVQESTPQERIRLQASGHIPRPIFRPSRSATRSAPPYRARLLPIG